jgi:hypothetical protein
MSDTLSEKLAALERMSPAQLRNEWREAFREPAPNFSPDLLARGIAYRLQERVYGGLADATRRELKRLVRELERTGEISGEREIQIKPGTRLVREWGGRTHHITVTEAGFSYDDRQFTSLSQIASAITGTKWSGPRFFGLKRRPSPPKRGRGAA